MCQVFTCASEVCKAKVQDVLHYQDSKDVTSTGNLKRHAIRCFRDEVVDATLKRESIIPLGHRGQGPVQHLYHVCTNLDLR